ncbi:MAG: site-specific DNA-methyltransferase [Gammaproteobacteria bacterium]|nr:site-specific DNA-methyltransferase [Gammaproteobacteria bacterium]
MSSETTIAVDVADEKAELLEVSESLDSETKDLVTVLPSGDVLDTLSSIPENTVTATILDPWYNKGVGGYREDYHDWLEGVIASAAKISKHIFVWGFPEIVAHQLTRMPAGFKLMAWLTWYYKNCPSVIRGWRSAQNTCLHIAAEEAKIYPENFLNPAQLERFKSGKMRFVPGPPAVLEAPLNIGFVGKDEQTGHPAQKPVSVIEPLILMTTRCGDVVLDPMCGSGTTGEACINLNRKGILCDESEEWLEISRKRIQREPSRCESGQTLSLLDP